MIAENGPTRATSGSNADDRAVMRNAVSQFAGFFVNIAIGLALAPILLRNLGQDSFGVWTAVLALVGYVGLGELGLGTATVRRVAAEFAADDLDAVGRVASTSLVIYFGTAAVGTGAVTGAVFLLGRLLDVPQPLVHQGQWALVVLGLVAAGNFTLSIYPAIVFGAGRSDLLTAVGIVSNLTVGIAQITTALLTDDLRALASVTAVSTLATAQAVRVIARRRYPGIDIRLRRADRRTAGQLLGSGWRNALIAITALAAFNTDVLIVGAFLSASAVAAYGIATRAAGILQSVAFRIGDVLVPTYSHHDASGSTARVYRMYVETTLVSSALAIPCALVVLVSAPELLDMWLGTVPSRSADVLVLLTFGTVLAVPGASAFSLLSGIDRLGFVVKASLASAVANVTIGLLLTPAIGVTGPALATLCCRAAFDLLVLPVYVCRQLDRPWQGWWLEVATVLCLPTLAALLAIGVLAMTSLSGPGLVLAAACSVTLTFFPTLWLRVGDWRQETYVALLRRQART